MALQVGRRSPSGDKRSRNKSLFYVRLRNRLRARARCNRISCASALTIRTFSCDSIRWLFSILKDEERLSHLRNDIFLDISATRGT